MPPSALDLNAPIIKSTDMKSHIWKLVMLMSGIQFQAQLASSGSPQQIEVIGNQPSSETAAGVRAADERSFVVMTFNVGTTLGLGHDTGPDNGFTSTQARISDRWYCNGLAWRPAIAAVRETIKDIDPDIVAIQEICKRSAGA